MEIEGNHLLAMLSTPEAYLSLLFLVLGFLVGYILSLLLHRARIRALERDQRREAAYAEQNMLEAAKWKEERATTKAALQSSRQEVEQLRQKLQATKREMQTLISDKDELIHNIQKANGELEKLKAAEAAYEHNMDQMTQKLRDLKAENEALENGPSEARPSPAAGPQPERERQVAQLHKRLETLAEQVEALQQENESLRQELDKQPGGPGLLEPVLDAAATASPHPQQPAALHPYQPANGAATINGAAHDNLTLIRGIGPFRQRQLVRLGIRTFEDVIRLQPERIRELTRELRMVAGRIEEEDWVGQAGRLQSLKLNDPDAFAKLASHPTDRSDLQLIVGIEPQVEALLYEAGIRSWDALADTPVERLRNILRESGSGFQMQEPHSWPLQAALAAQGHWKLLEDYQKRLQGGHDLAASA